MVPSMYENISSQSEADARLLVTMTDPAVLEATLKVQV